jgi:hypothetical protein
MKKRMLIVVGLFICQTTFAILVVGWEFDTEGDVEGWAGAQINDLKQATAVGSGGEGVLTSGNIIGNNPNLATPGLTLAEGEEWARIEFRIRQLDGNSPSGAPKVFNNTKTWLQFNDSSDCLLADWQTKTYDRLNDEGGFIARDYANDSFVMTVTEQENEWMLISLDLSGAVYTKTNDISVIKLWPVRNDTSVNFEIDYFRVHDTAIPEPGTMPLLMLGGSVGIIMLRRRWFL